MRRFWLGAVSLALFAPSLFATNGDNLIGIGPASRGMGGIGTGMPVGAIDSIFRNPAWMSYFNTKRFFLSFGGILFMPNVKVSSRMLVDDNPFAPSGGMFMSTNGRIKSDADMFMVPEVGIVHKVNERLALGIGAFGVSGMGVDFRDKDLMPSPMGGYTNALSQMHTSFQFMRLTPAVAYRVNEFLAVGGAVHIAWGSLDMGAQICEWGDADGDMLPEPTRCWNAGGGQSQDFGLGFSVGIALDFGDFIYAGVAYQSPISMKYKNVFDSNGDGKFEDMKLEQPQEFAFGVGVRPLENLKVGLDVRWIDWSGADGYGDFGWEDQWVFALGVEFKPLDTLALRAGYNYGKTPIRDKDNLNPMVPKNRVPDLARAFTDFELYWFNLVGFPAIAEHHLTLGLNWRLTPNFDLDLSYVYALPSTVSAKAMGGAGEVSARMFQHSIGIGLNWSF
ncbi:MAG: aromatic hydrocarbon degradation protein [Aquificae bacterium]|nr:aromatic hydrocarbon degradation protein [Aquificota bacterium]